MVRAVLFDIGGVLVALDGVPSMARLLNVAAAHDVIHDIWMTSPAVVAHETGRLSAVDFAAGVVADLNLPITPALFLQDFCAWPRFVLDGAFELLDDIPQEYTIAALSNTSAVHWERIGALGLAGRFAHAYLSHEMGCLKPSDEAFQIALDGLGLAPSDVVFLDDGVRNVAAAGRLGMRAHLTKNPGEARRVLHEYGVVR